MDYFLIFKILYFSKVWFFVVFYHAALGLQVVIEDYVATESIRIIASWGINLCFIFLALISLFEMLNILSIG